MTREQSAGWDEIRARIKRQWPTLADEDLDGIAGDRNRLLELLEGRLGYARGNAQGDVDAIFEGYTHQPEGPSR